MPASQKNKHFFWTVHTWTSIAALHMTQHEGTVREKAKTLQDKRLDEATFPPPLCIMQNVPQLILKLFSSSAFPLVVQHTCPGFTSGGVTKSQQAA